MRPHGLVTLGNVALQSFLRDTVGHLHGQWTRAVVSPPEKEAFTLPLFPLYHPASIIYNPHLQEDYGARPCGASGIPACKNRRSK